MVKLLAFASLLLVVSSAHAQLGTGSLTGVVTDADSGRIVSDAAVTASSPDLQIEQLVLSDRTGRFYIPNLPPGTYSVHIDAESFHPLDNQQIALQSGATLQLELKLLPEVLSSAEIEVVAHTPTVDIASTRSGVTIGEETTRRVPVAPPSGKGGAARSFEQLAELAPTARNDTYGASVAGTTSPENVYLIDGLNTRDPSFGYNATPLSIDFIKQTSVLTGGYLPEYGRGGGGVIEVVTKSGTNDLHGSLFGYASPWAAGSRYIAPQDSISTISRLGAVRDIGFDDLRSLLINRTGDLAGDRRHEIKLFVSKDIALGAQHTLNVGAGYQARSGAPTNVLGRHLLYGSAEVFVLPRGSGERLPWTHNIDLHLAYQFAQTKSQTLAFTVDIFNLFNFQQIIAINESYTYRAVEPIVGTAASARQVDPKLVRASDLSSNPRPFDDTDKNRAFGAPTRYQAPFTLRLGIRSTF